MRVFGRQAWSSSRTYRRARIRTVCGGGGGLGGWVVLNTSSMLYVGQVLQQPQHTGQTLMIFIVDTTWTRYTPLMGKINNQLTMNVVILVFKHL